MADKRSKTMVSGGSRTHKEANRHWIPSGSEKLYSLTVPVFFVCARSTTLRLSVAIFYKHAAFASGSDLVSCSPFLRNELKDLMVIGFSESVNIAPGITRHGHRDGHHQRPRPPAVTLKFELRCTARGNSSGDLPGARGADRVRP
jgi:hypothetical protein